MNIPHNAIKLTEDGKRLFSGAALFDLKSTHGFPLDFALDRIINDAGLAVDWPEFIETARRNEWWDFQTHETLCHAMSDAMLPRDMQQAIRERFKQYVLTHPHPKMTHNAKGQRGAACGASAAPTGCASNGNYNERTEK